MGTVYKKRITRPLPAGAEVATRRRRATTKELRRNPQQATVLETVATWRDRTGKKRTAVVVVAADGSQRVRVESETYYAKFRDGNNLVQEVPTGCRDLQAAKATLADLLLTAERVKAKVLTPADCRMIEQADVPLEQHLQTYFDGLSVAGVTKRHIADLKRLSNCLITECGFRLLRDIDPEAVERWLLLRTREDMGARTRNTYLQSLDGFCNWCVESGRLRDNPLDRIKKADEAADRRRERRALSESELRRLLLVARWRPLAEFGRLSKPGEAPGKATKTKKPTETKKRSNWHLEPLTFDDLPAALDRARERLKNNPGFVAELERRGWERSLVYKVAVLTGLRRGELQALTAGHLYLDGPTPFVRMQPAETKNKKAVDIPLRADLVDDLRAWLKSKRNQQGEPVLKLSEPADLSATTPLFAVPQQLVKALDRDLSAAGIPKTDDRGRTVDVHALRHSFGTLLSTSGVAPRTAQQVMRHSRIDLTMQVYTDPRLLDVAGAIDALPALSLSERPERGFQRATGTDDRSRTVAPTVAPAGDFCVQNRTIADKMGEPVDSVGTQKNPANLAISQGLFSEVDGARTRNLRRDRPVDDAGTTPEFAGILWDFGNGCTNCCTCDRCLVQLANDLSRCLNAEQLDRVRGLLGPSPG